MDIETIALLGVYVSVGLMFLIGLAHDLIVSLIEERE